MIKAVTISFFFFFFFFKQTGPIALVNFAYYLFKIGSYITYSPIKNEEEVNFNFGSLVGS